MSEMEIVGIFGKKEDQGVTRFDFLKSVRMGLGVAGLGAVLDGETLA